jgi:hypothetical protein
VRLRTPPLYARAGRPSDYIYLGTDGDGRYEHLFNEDLIKLGLARTTDFPHCYSRQFERLREEAKGDALGALAPRCQI